jgi:hypothetical protein
MEVRPKSWPVHELYAEVLRRTIVKVAGEWAGRWSPAAQFLPNSVAYWLPFREPTRLDRLGKSTRSGSSQHRRQTPRISAATCGPN